jgi:hypothetical protein
LLRFPDRRGFGDCPTGKQERAEAITAIRTRVKDDLLGDLPETIESAVPSKSASPVSGEAEDGAALSTSQAASPTPQETSSTDAVAWKRQQSTPLVEDTSLDGPRFDIDYSTFSTAYKVRAPDSLRGRKGRLGRIVHVG